MFHGIGTVVTAGRPKGWLYDARLRKTGSPPLLEYVGRYRSVLYELATSSLRGPRLGSGMGTRSYRPLTNAAMRPLLPSSMASYAILPNVSATSLSIKSGSPERRSYVRSDVIVSAPARRVISPASASATLAFLRCP